MIHHCASSKSISLIFTIVKSASWLKKIILQIRFIDLSQSVLPGSNIQSAFSCTSVFGMMNTVRGGQRHRQGQRSGRYKGVCLKESPSCPSAWPFLPGADTSIKPSATLPWLHTPSILWVGMTHWTHMNTWSVPEILSVPCFVCQAAGFGHHGLSCVCKYDMQCTPTHRLVWFFVCVLKIDLSLFLSPISSVMKNIVRSRTQSHLHTQT